MTLATVYALPINDGEEFPATYPTPLYLPEGIGEIVLRPETGRFTAAEFWAFCVENSDLRLELTSAGEVLVRQYASPLVSHKNCLLMGVFGQWEKKDQTGLGFGATAGFTLPNGAVRSPNLSWMRRERWEALTPEEKEAFSPSCPDFVVEFRSRHDELKKLQAKLEEYLDNGAQLGWLIDPGEKRFYVYRPGAPVKILDNPTEVSGEPLLKGFVLNLADIFD